MNYNIPDMTTWNRHQKLHWHMVNPEMSSYIQSQTAVLEYIALKGWFVNEEENRHILVNIIDDASFAFNNFVNYLENAHPTNDSNERDSLLEKCAYPKALFEEAFENICATFFVRRGEFPDDTLGITLSDLHLNFNYTSQDDPYDPQWWEFRFIDEYLNSSIWLGEKPFSPESD
jgi:hypothetical protein